MTCASMKVGVVCAERERWPKMRWVRQALTVLGHRVSAIHDRSALASSDADLLIFEHKNAGLCAGDIVELSRSRKCPWVQVWFDLIVTQPDKPLADQSYIHPDNFGRVLKCFDKVYVRELDYIDQYQELGVNAEYLDQCCPSHMPSCSHEKKPEFDVFVFGSIHGYQQRNSDVKALVDAGFKVAWAGHVLDQGPPKGVVPLNFIPPCELPRMASRAAVTLGVDYTHKVRGYWSDRMWLALGMGSCHLRRTTAGLPQLPMFQYADTQQLVERVAHLSQEHETRSHVGRNAREFTMKNATYETRMKELISQCPKLVAHTME